MARYILGFNKYSQSTSCALLDTDGNVHFALSLERLTRKKFAGGDVAELTRMALQQAGIALSDVALVVENCHLFRIDAFERRLRFAVGQHHFPSTYLDPMNLGADCPAPKMEISHHMAHAFGARLACPFDKGVIVVMDGMGSLRSDVETDATDVYRPETLLPTAAGFRECPADATPATEWREAESVFLFEGAAMQRLFKRWSPLRSPSLLYNYGFENMESLGAVYSRVSSHIFKDWNACGKVMGLAGYGAPSMQNPIMSGPLESLAVNWEYLDTLTPAEGWDAEDSADLNKELAATVQANLESVALEFLTRLRQETGARNLVLTGGVALNSQLNALIAAKSGFENVFAPSAPGDDGVALGCAAYGLSQLNPSAAAPRRGALTAYLGGTYDETDLADALQANRDRVTVQRTSDIATETARLIEQGLIVGWYQGRSEYGPRALGNRSILAHPGIPHMKDTLNGKVKFRESFRPFAPTVLAEAAGEYFEEASPSRYMSFAVPVHKDKQGNIPSVVHVDGTARLQHLERSDNPLYYDLIAAFRERTGLPLILNTSFNVAGQPIVETPEEAIWTLLNSDMDALALGSCLVAKRALPDASEWADHEVSATDDVLIETVYHGSGDFDHATLYFQGQGFEATELSLAVLECCNVRSTLSDLLDAVCADMPVNRDVAEAEIHRLFHMGVIALR